MNDKKSLDRLFQEKFKDFESEPNPQVWKNIEAALKEKDDRKVIPFWWKLSGVAAGLLLGLFAWNLISDDPAPQNSVVIEQHKATTTNPAQNDAVANTGKTAEKGSLKNNPSGNPTDTSVSHPNPALETAGENAVAQQDNAVQNAKAKNATRITTDGAVAEASNTIQKKKTKNGKKIAPAGQQNAVVNTTKVKKPAETTFQGTNNAVADNNKTADKKSRSKGKNALKTTDANADNNNSGIAGVSSDQSKNNQPTKAAASNQVNPGESQPEKAVAATHGQGKNLNNTTGTNPNSATEQKVALKEVPENNKLDTIPAMIVPNPLEELLRQKNEKETKVAETKLNRWQISSNVAPVYFSSTSEGSPIDKQFAGNDKSYENNLTYGVGVNYAVNKKLSVRAGVQKLDFNYNTNDVVFYAGLGAQAFDNISPAGNAAFLEVMSQAAAASIGLVPGENGLQDISTGAMTQRMGYIEVPLEVSYKLIDRKFGVSIIGGVSTLFLNENEVTVASSSSATTAVLGKANNLNEVHFSSNLGIGFKYNFLKDFQFNFEPTLKYQINTFSKDAGNFKPYFIGLYSGISFSF